jgi:radical SAM protein with 4Fe4S-binding SPASM domain
MRPGQFKKALPFIYNLMQELHINPTHIFLNYIGGEILTVPPSEINEIVRFGRSFFAERGLEVNDGCQSNLIGSDARVDNLIELFGEHRVSTSIDNFSEKRKLGGSATKYRTFFLKQDQRLLKKNRRIPAVFVVDDEGSEYVLKELKNSAKQGRSLSLRPVFQGGSTIEYANQNKLADVLLQCLNTWFMRMPIIVEPFFGMFKKRILEKQGKSLSNFVGCNFQNDCATKSINLDPNGDLYLCQEISDAGKLKLGNAYLEIFDRDAWQRIKDRTYHLDDECRTCEYLAACQGGCMAEALEQGKGIYGKPNNCLLWKVLFKRIDELIDQSGIDVILDWLNRVETNPLLELERV